MTILTKLAHAGHPGRRPPAGGMFGHLRKALAARPGHRRLRPLQDLDGWSDQAEVAFYEDCRACHLG